MGKLTISMAIFNSKLLNYPWITMEYMAHFWLIYHIHLELEGNWGKHNAVNTW
jgi:hypothetical protein